MILLNGFEVEFKTFPNGETHVIKDVFEHNAYLELGEDNIITFKYESDADLVRLMFVKQHLDNMSSAYSHLLIYYMPYSRMDRSEEGSVFTLKYVADMINMMMFNGVYIVEPHSDVTCALIDRSEAIMVTQPLLDSVLNEVQFDLEHDYVVFPDAGAQKRYAKMFGGNVLVGHKHRDFATGKITKFDLVGVPYPKPEGRKAIIVDDLCSYGGTFIATAEALKAQGFDEIYLIVAHCEKSITAGNIFKSGLINKVFTSDSIITINDVVWTDAQYRSKIDITSIQELIVID